MKFFGLCGTSMDVKNEVIVQPQPRVDVNKTNDIKKKTEHDDPTPPHVKMIADGMVRHNVISAEEGEKQLSAIQSFYQGKMSYAEMRMIAG